MGIFGLLNYEDYLLRTIANSNYAKKSLTVLLIYLVTALARFHLSLVLCYIFSVDSVINLIIPVIINVILSLLSGTIYNYVSTHKNFYERTAQYLITNYSLENFKRWKRYFMLVIFVYILVALFLVTIDNNFILIVTLQTLANFVICDIIDNFTHFEALFFKHWNKPKVNKLIRDFSIVDDYKIDPDFSDPIKPQISRPINVLDIQDNDVYPIRPISPPVSPKPRTPPSLD